MNDVLQSAANGPRNALPPDFTDEAFEDQLPGVRELWRAVYTRWPLVLFILILGGLAGLYLASSLRRYSSTATLRIEPANANALEISSQVLNAESSKDEDLNSEVLIMQARSIQLKVAQDLHLADNPDFWDAKKAPHLDAEEPSARDKVMEQMRKVVAVARVPKTNIIEVTCTTSSPLLSAKIANSITNEYITRMFQLRFGSTDRVSQWLGGELTELKNQVERDQEQLVDLKGKLGVLNLDEKSNAYLLADSLQEITRASGDATIQRIIAEAKLRVLTDSDPNLIEGEQPLLQGNASTNNSNGLLQNLRNAETQAAANYASLTARLGPDYPDVKEAKAKLDKLTEQVNLEQARIVNQAKISYSAAASNEKMTSDVLNNVKNKAFASRNDMVHYVVLERQYEADRALYESLTERLRVAGINAGLESAKVDIIDLATVPSIARKPLPWQWFLLSIAASLFGAVLLAIVMDRFDDRLGRPEDAEKLLKLPLLAVLQRFPDKFDRDNFEELKRGAYAEGLQLLRSGFLMSRPDRPPTSVLVTSAVPAEGKSTVSRDLAAMLAMHHSRVLLIDADLHKPAQSTALRLGRVRGLSDLLSSPLDPSEVIVPLPSVEGLFLLPAGRTPPQPATLLSSEKMQELVQRFTAEYDFVVIDSPPVLRVSDSILCAPLADVVLLIVRENEPSVKEVRQTINLLRRGQGNVIGFAMNAVTSRGSGYDSYYQDYGNYGTGNYDTKEGETGA